MISRKVFRSLIFFVYSSLLTSQAQTAVCIDLFAANARSERAAPVQTVERIQALAQGLDIMKGSGRIRMEAKFGPAYVEKLYEKLVENMPKTGSVALISKHKKQSLSPDQVHLFEPIFSYAQDIIDGLNASVSPQERGRLAIETMRLAISNGKKKQLGQAWHRDDLRYMSVLTNLKGAGTIMDANPPLPTKDDVLSTIPPTPPSTESLPVGQAVIFNGLIRHFMLKGPGTNPLLHSAPSGIGDLRLSIIIFIAPQSMDAPEVNQGLYSLEAEKNGGEDLRQKLIKQYLNQD